MVPSGGQSWTQTAAHARRQTCRLYELLADNPWALTGGAAKSVCSLLALEWNMHKIMEHVVEHRRLLFGATACEWPRGGIKL